ncbi:MAG: hypothetical protein ACFFAQ_09160 [Promethearchaeota archaeon]
MEALFTIIICQNCGATNQDVKFCRKCGALLPVSSKSSRLRVSVSKTKKEKGQKLQNLDLQEIPKESESIDQLSVNDEILEDFMDNDAESIIVPKSEESLKDKREVLKEITPQPYRSSIMASNSVSLSHPRGETSRTQTLPQNTEAESTLMKQKQLEKDMTEVLGFLSKKITVKKLDTSKSKTKKEKVAEEKIPPASMNEILNQLLTLDLHIEASAIIKDDGTILASALSNRISDTLFATIGQTLNQIGADILNGLSAGSLKSISVKGTEGVIDLAPIDKESQNIKDMILVIYSYPKAKSGIINFAANIVKKQIIEYLGIKI